MSAADVVDDGVTAEGREATVLDPAINLKFERAKRLVEKDKNFDEAAEILSDLLTESTERYGQLCPLVAPIYYHYGDALLRGIEQKADALAEERGGEESGEEGSGEEGEGEEKGGEERTGQEGRGEEGAEEDLTKEAEEENDDETIAFECLDVARVIYGRVTPATKESELELARVHLRLGDLYSEGDKFSDAFNEYKECLAIRSKHLERHDRRLADVLSALSNAYIQLASSKDVAESSRKQYLSHSLLQTQAATECLALLSADKADKLAVNAEYTHIQGPANTFLQRIRAEIAAGALSYQYPAGRTESVAALSSSASTAATAATPDGKQLAEPEIVVFQTVFKTTLAPELEASESSSVSMPESVAADVRYIQELCEIVDALLQRMTDITADLGISVNKLINDIAAASGMGTTTIGFGASTAPSNVASETIGFGAPTGAADAPSATLAPRKKAVTADTSAAPAIESVSGVKRRPAEADLDGDDAPAAKIVRSE